VESSEGGPQGGIPLGKHFKGQAQKLGKRERFAKLLVEIFKSEGWR